MSSSIIPIIIETMMTIRQEVTSSIIETMMNIRTTSMSMKTVMKKRRRKTEEEKRRD